MQVKRLSYQVKGFVKLADYTIRWLRMVSDKAKHKARVLAFWDKHGIGAAMEAFKVGRRTLFLWKQQLRQGNGVLESLNEQSRRPQQLRRREWPQPIKDEVRRLRQAHPNLGKEKIQVFLRRFCAEHQLACPSVSTIGNLVRDMGGLRITPQKVRHNGTIVPRRRAPKPRKPKQFKALYPGHCGAFDTIEKIIHGCRRYVLTFTDLFTRFSIAWATTSHASDAAREFFELVRFLFPLELTYVLTDNGSEFMKHFDQELKRLHKEHWHTYPRTPKMNAHAERFNRTLQEEFLDFHAGKLLKPDLLNQELLKYLLWFNTERPHHGLDLKTPLECANEYLKSQAVNLQECNMWLTNTTT